ncbi:MAG: molybdopterin converting factor subunit 1 [Thiobacillus sp.]|nr:molybdopterin converting factor subunit 1 [Thiobacillus sp.]
MNIRLLYFARLREVFGLGREDMELPSPASLADLLEALRGRGGVWAQELAPGRAFRLAVNQDIAGQDAPLREGDEVAIFPPVTGG